MDDSTGSRLRDEYRKREIDARKMGKERTKRSGSHEKRQPFDM